MVGCHVGGWKRRSEWQPVSLSVGFAFQSDVAGLSQYLSPVEPRRLALDGSLVRMIGARNPDVQSCNGVCHVIKLLPSLSFHIDIHLVAHCMFLNQFQCRSTAFDAIAFLVSLRLTYRRLT